MKKKFLLLSLALVMLILTSCGKKGDSAASDGKNAEIKGKIVIYTSMYEDIIDNVKEKLKEDSKRFIKKAIDKGYVEYAGAELDSILPPTSRRQGAREAKKLSVLEKIRKIVEVFVGV